MNNKIQAKDLINLGLFTVLYFVIGCCVAIPIGFVPIFLPVLTIIYDGADHRHPIYAVPDKGEKVRDGHHYGHFERPADGVDRHGLLGRPPGGCFWTAG